MNHLVAIRGKALDDESHEHDLHVNLSRFNRDRLSPGLVDQNWLSSLQQDIGFQIEEGKFVEKQRQAIQDLMVDIPYEPKQFLRWFENLRISGPGQGDVLFPWLANHATMDEMCWFLSQEAAGEAGFDDLVALTQIKLPVQAKLEMARNYWDEMGRGHEPGMHGPMLATVVRELKLSPTIEGTVWESLALANLMLALGINRRYAFQSIGALGVIEMTAPTRVGYVNEGLKRLNVPFNVRRYFQLHATLDVKHSRAWNDEVIYTIVESNPNAVKPIAEGALMRLMSGARCFERYRRHFSLSS